jgi:RNA polymerase sigma-70 factor (ECF subfamily)
LTPTANSLVALRLTGTKTVEEVSRLEESGPIERMTRGLAAGDEGAFREFHAVYFDRLYQFLLVVARGQEEEAQEALQQTLLRVLRYARVFESEEVFWGWLKVLARSAARDAGRKQRRYRALLQRFALFGRTEARAPETAEEDSLRAMLEEGLQGLEAADRRLIEGKYLEGATVKELAAQMGLSEKAVESRLVRLRQQLRQKLVRGKEEGRRLKDEDHDGGPRE